MDARLGSARRASLRRGSTFTAAPVLFGAIFTLRAGDSNIGDGVGFLFVVPLAVLALGFVNRAVAFAALSVMLGAFVMHRRRLEAGFARHYEGALAERTRELDDALAEALRLLARTVEYRDDETSQHTERVGAIAVKMAAELGLPAAEIKLLGEAAPLHDVGKIAIPDEILLKRENLDEHEQGVMRTHAALGATLLSKHSRNSPVLRMAATIAATHHEWWDGTGYPHGLAGEHIPLVGRIVAVADVFDALTHDRPYKPAWPMTQGIARIKRAAGSQFDPRVVDAFLATQAALAGSGHEPEHSDEARVADPLTAHDTSPMRTRSFGDALDEPGVSLRGS